MKYKGVVLFKYYQTLEVEANSEEEARDLMFSAFDISKADGESEIYDMWEEA